MSSVISLSTSRKIRKVVGMRIGNEIILDLIELILIVIILIFIFVNFGFDIKELVAAFPATLSAVALGTSQ
jgi:preprotein translocase subunit SecF